MLKPLLMLGLILGLTQGSSQLDIQLLEELCNAFGPSGFEEEVQRTVRDRGRELSDEVLYDRSGSVIFKKVGSQAGPKVMLAGHADEIGFVIRGDSQPGPGDGGELHKPL